MKLPGIIQSYVDASNRHDVNGILACFSGVAVVHDEGKEFHGKKMIEDWTPFVVRAMPTATGGFQILLDLLRGTSDRLVQCREQKL